uniref:transposase n=1 Tax=Klebsiella grimontii TaxID=2058152 RepID=UPI00292DB3B6
MRKARFTEHQIIAVIKSVEAGRTVKDVCREAGISEATYYNWKSRYGGMEASDIKKIKDLEDENRRLKQMFAGLAPIFPDTFYRLTHYWFAAADIPV